jgi:hypothetical protein
VAIQCSQLSELTSEDRDPGIRLSAGNVTGNIG